MDEEDNSDIYRLEGSSDQGGGLIIKKKQESSVEFKVPAPKKSLLGLDNLAGNNSFTLL